MAGSSSPLITVSVLLVVAATLLCTAVSKRSLPPNQCASKPFRCRSCGRNNYINVKIIAKNVLVTPNFEHNVTIYREPQCSLVHFLEQAAELNGYFNFSSSYHRSLGYMVNTINHVTADVSAKTYWNIKSVTNGYNSLLCGVSTYIPKHGEEILFNFTSWA
ncbi:hypothetical protein BsWGS_05175 [Bradybaena similaris]